MQPDYKDSYKSMPYLPEIDLNNLFKWAVPKLSGLSLTTFYTPDFKAIEHYEAWVDIKGRENEVMNKDPALALFWAIWKVIKEDKQ